MPVNRPEACTLRTVGAWPLPEEHDGSVIVSTSSSQYLDPDNVSIQVPGAILSAPSLSLTIKNGYLDPDAAGPRMNATEPAPATYSYEGWSLPLMYNIFASLVEALTFFIIIYFSFL